jgi:hypothetical protein
VSFSGQFFSDTTDCVKESSLTLKGSLTQPEFIFRFSAIGPVGAAGPNLKDDGPSATPKAPERKLVTETSTQDKSSGGLRLPTPQSGNYSQFCSEKWTKRGILDAGMFDYCMSGQAKADDTLADLASKNASLTWLQRVIDAAVEKWTKRGMRDEEMVAYKVSQEIDAYLDIVYASKNSGFRQEALAACTDKWQTDELPWGMILYCYKRATGTD